MHLKENNMKKVCHGVNLMSGYKSKRSKSVANEIEKTTLEYVIDLSKYYNRFNRYDHRKCADHVKSNAFGNNSHFAITNRFAKNLRTNTLQSQRTRLYFTKSFKDL